MTTPDTLLDRALASVEPEDESTRRVLDGALEEFLNLGIRRSTMNDIARRAKLGVATVYRRFPQKDDLVEAVLLREVRRFIAACDATIDHSTTAEGEVVEGFVAFVVGAREHPLLRRLLSTEPESVLPILTVDGGPVIALAREYLTQTIRRLQREGKLGDFTPEPIAELFARLAHSLLLTPDGIIPAGDDDHTRDFARRYIAPLLIHAGCS